MKSMEKQSMLEREGNNRFMMKAAFVVSTIKAIK